MLQLFGFELKLVSFSSEHGRLYSENLASFDFLWFAILVTIEGIMIAGVEVEMNYKIPL